MIGEAICHVVKDLGDVAKLKRLLLEKEPLSAIPTAIPSGIALVTTEALATADLSAIARMGDGGSLLGDGGLVPS